MYRKILQLSFWRALGKRWYVNAYTLTLAGFLLWVLFFDNNNLIIQYQLQQTVNELEEEKQYYREQLDVIRKMKKDLIENRERLAREKYFMHKPGEDVYIIEKE